MSLSRKFLIRSFRPLSSSIKNIAIGQDHPGIGYEGPGGNFGARWRWVVALLLGQVPGTNSTEGRQHDSLYSVSFTSSHVS